VSGTDQTHIALLGLGYGLDSNGLMVERRVAAGILHLAYGGVLAHRIERDLPATVLMHEGE